MSAIRYSLTPKALAYLTVVGNASTAVGFPYLDVRKRSLIPHRVRVHSRPELGPCERRNRQSQQVIPRVCALNPQLAEQVLHTAYGVFHRPYTGGCGETACFYSNIRSQSPQQKTKEARAATNDPGQPSRKQKTRRQMSTMPPSAPAAKSPQVGG